MKFEKLVLEHALLKHRLELILKLLELGAHPDKVVELGWIFIAEIDNVEVILKKKRNRRTSFEKRQTTLLIKERVLNSIRNGISEPSKLRENSGTSYYDDYWDAITELLGEGLVRSEGENQNIRYYLNVTI